jgi:nitroreductase
MNLLEQLNWRYATKRMNGTKVPQEKLNTILEAIRLAPTSLGLQPFKVIVIEDQAFKEQIFKDACQQPQIKESSQVLVFASNKKVTPELVKIYLELLAETREISVESLSHFDEIFNRIINQSENENFAWTARQAYIALGVGLVAAALENVDATPIEGFNAQALDHLLGLKEQNLGSVVIMTIGYRDEKTDYLFSKKKVRKNNNSLFSYI